MGLFDNTLAVRVDTMPRHIGGISCDAKNCMYHDGDSYCTADLVRIGNLLANSSSETRCSTFEPRTRK